MTWTSTPTTTAVAMAMARLVTWPGSTVGDDADNITAATTDTLPSDTKHDAKQSMKTLARVHSVNATVASNATASAVVSSSSMSDGGE